MLFGSWRSVLARLNPTSRVKKHEPRRNKGRSPRQRLLLELLEDRLAPAILYVANTPGNGGAAFTPTGGDQTTQLGVNPFATISAAVAAANPGDTINVADGTYNELVSLNKTGLILQGNKFNTDGRI